MKSVCLAAWYLTVAFGNVIVIIVAEARAIENQVWEYVFFAGLLLLATVIFGVMSFFYKYTDKQDEKSDKNKKSNKIEAKI